MLRIMKLSCICAPVCLLIGFGASVCFAQSAATDADTAIETIKSLSVTSTDRNAQIEPTSSFRHVMGVAGKPAPQPQKVGMRVNALQAKPQSAIHTDGLDFYPADLSNPYDNPTVDWAESHPIYVNGGPDVWGKPALFLRHLANSRFIHVVDQYVGATGNDRYRVGDSALILAPNLPQTLVDPVDIAPLVHAAASVYGTGYHHVYHLFFPPGTDICFEGGECYSPDNPPNFYFCAYHGAYTFTDIGEVLYTVQPYQNVAGCAVSTPTPNGVVADSTASVLSHELIETITDPDLDAWLNWTDLDLFGYEIGDECQRAVFTYGHPVLAGRAYQIQPEYSNKAHACVYSPNVETGEVP